eukprot:gnl/Chilomastix_cuspidata/221.p1 GENE.gnl/Chilomastix_cuspidata/221~~gnl/Chilomastix_cuspidata/221.p1  ORF type:complete len:1124 (+),score=367.00 gnl/Chilomastix_cuspidata/221:97-3468(+)
MNYDTGSFFSSEYSHMDDRESSYTSSYEGSYSYDDSTTLDEYVDKSKNLIQELKNIQKRADMRIKEYEQAMLGTRTQLTDEGVEYTEDVEDNPMERLEKLFAKLEDSTDTQASSLASILEPLFASSDPLFSEAKELNEIRKEIMISPEPFARRDGAALKATLSEQEAEAVFQNQRRIVGGVDKARGRMMEARAKMLRTKRDVSSVIQRLVSTRDMHARAAQELNDKIEEIRAQQMSERLESLKTQRRLAKTALRPQRAPPPRRPKTQSVALNTPAEWAKNLYGKKVWTLETRLKDTESELVDLQDAHAQMRERLDARERRLAEAEQENAYLNERLRREKSSVSAIIKVFHEGSKTERDRFIQERIISPDTARAATARAAQEVAQAEAAEGREAHHVEHPPDLIQIVRDIVRKVRVEFPPIDFRLKRHVEVQTDVPAPSTPRPPSPTATTFSSSFEASLATEDHTAGAEKGTQACPRAPQTQVQATETDGGASVPTAVHEVQTTAQCIIYEARGPDASPEPLSSEPDLEFPSMAAGDPPEPRVGRDSTVSLCTQTEDLRNGDLEPIVFHCETEDRAVSARAAMTERSTSASFSLSFPSGRSPAASRFTQTRPELAPVAPGCSHKHVQCTLPNAQLAAPRVRFQSPNHLTNAQFLAIHGAVIRALEALCRRARRTRHRRTADEVGAEGTEGDSAPQSTRGGLFAQSHRADDEELPLAVTKEQIIQARRDIMDAKRAVAAQPSADASEYLEALNYKFASLQLIEKLERLLEGKDRRIRRYSDFLSEEQRGVVKERRRKAVDLRLVEAKKMLKNAIRRANSLTRDIKKKDAKLRVLAARVAHREVQHRILFEKARHERQMRLRQLLGTEDRVLQAATQLEDEHNTALTKISLRRLRFDNSLAVRAGLSPDIEASPGIRGEAVVPRSELPTVASARHRRPPTPQISLQSLRPLHTPQLFKRTSKPPPTPEEASAARRARTAPKSSTLDMFEKSTRVSAPAPAARAFNTDLRIPFREKTANTLTPIVKNVEGRLIGDLGWPQLTRTPVPSRAAQYAVHDLNSTVRTRSRARSRPARPPRPVRTQEAPRVTFPLIHTAPSAEHNPRLLSVGTAQVIPPRTHRRMNSPSFF